MVDPSKWSFLLRAMLFAQLGNEPKSSAAMGTFLEHMPRWSITKELNAIRFKRRDDEIHWVEGLRKAGLAECGTES